MRELGAESQARSIKPELSGYFSELSQELCLRLNNSLDRLKISGIEREKLVICINFLAIKDVKTAEHCIRVALLCEQIAYEEGIDPKALFYPGLLHDMGKALIPFKVLKKSEGFNEDDMKVMREHPLLTFRLIGDIFSFSGNVGVRHHRHQRNAYPSELPEAERDYSDKTVSDMDYLSRIVSIADSFDSAVSRRDGKFGRSEPLKPEEAFEAMIEEHPNDSELINHLRNKTAFVRHLKLVNIKKQ